MPQVFIRPLAERDLIEAYEFIMERSGEDRAMLVLRRISKKMAELARYPNSGRRRDELYPDLRSMPVSGYIIFYFPIHEGIRVSRVLYGRRDVESVFEGEPDDGE